MTDLEARCPVCRHFVFLHEKTTLGAVCAVNVPALRIAVPIRAFLLRVLGRWLR